MPAADQAADRAYDSRELDQLVMAVAQERDREAFASLFGYFAPRLKAWLMKAGATEGDAEDFAQETMLTVWRKADLFDDRKARASTWVFTIARNKRLDRLRRDARPLPVPEITSEADEAPRPDELLSMSQDAQRIQKALSSLKPDQAEVLRLAFFIGSPHSEIARQLELPLGTVKSRIRNAMSRLRAILEPYEDEVR